MKKILIIKLGALGDVVRTTPLLRVLKGDITWVTLSNALPLLPSGVVKEVVSLDAAAGLRGRKFDLVLSLDDETRAAEVAVSVKAKELVGAFIDGAGKLSYTETSAAWFDMGLISRFGIQQADEIKKANARTYQEILFEMAGFQFRGEEYLIDTEGLGPRSTGDEVRIAIEARAGDRWPNKKWAFYEALAEKFSRDGYVSVFLQQRNNLSEYLGDIQQCDYFVTGDTLAMHLALALGKRGLGIFTCTSPAEIFDYGRLIKVVSPLWKKGFYRKDLDTKITTAISVAEVYQTADALIRSQQKTSKLD